MRRQSGQVGGQTRVNAPGDLADLVTPAHASVAAEWLPLEARQPFSTIPNG